MIISNQLFTNPFCNFTVNELKMEKQSNQVIPTHAGWVVKKSRSTRASRVFETKDKAVEYAEKLSKKEKTDLYIHEKNGMVRDRKSFA